jgi:hypothetical protein
MFFHFEDNRQTAYRALREGNDEGDAWVQVTASVRYFDIFSIFYILSPNNLENKAGSFK